LNYETPHPPTEWALVAGRRPTINSERLCKPLPRGIGSTLEQMRKRSATTLLTRNPFPAQVL
jgi:hypothetical protein